MRSAQRLSSLSLDAVNSALGITRISHVQVSQVLHATPSDVRILRSVLSSWNIPEFRSTSYPLLLRALTHPSISSWAERSLDLPRRSLGPNILELLGDCVVGVSTSHHILRWSTRSYLPQSPASLLKSFVCNKGMASVARSVGIERLLRWEKPGPPSAHRARLDERGIDVQTGVQANGEVNALSAAFEAVTAAVYLDGGYPAVLDRFLPATLLRDPRGLAVANRDSSAYEADLVSALSALIPGQRVHLVGGTDDRPTRNRSADSSGMRDDVPIVVEIHELKQPATSTVTEAHALFFAAVSVRCGNSDAPRYDEREMLSLASNFSVENARIAAVSQALDMLRGVRTPLSSVSPARRLLRMDTVVPREIIHTHIPRPKAVRQSDDALGGLRNRSAQRGLDTKFDEAGRWHLDSDYAHAGAVLVRARVPGLPGDSGSGEAVRSYLRSFCESSERAIEVEMMHGFEDIEGPLNSSTSYEAPHSAPTIENPGELSSVDVDAVQSCLTAGVEAIGRGDAGGLFASHSTLMPSDSDVDGRSLATRLDEQVGTVMRLHRRERNQRCVAFNSLGHQAVRAWAAQSSISDLAQDRQHVIPLFEGRVAACAGMEAQMMGASGLAHIRDGGGSVRRSYVAVGMCVEALGLPMAVAWLTGAESLRRKQVRR